MISEFNLGKEMYTDLYDLAQILRPVYGSCAIYNGAVIPTHIDAIKNFKLFEKSLCLLTNPVEQLNNIAFHPADFAASMRSKPQSLEVNDRVLITHSKTSKGKNTDIELGIRLTKKQRDDLEHYQGFKALNEMRELLKSDKEFDSYEMPDETRELILKYEFLINEIGVIGGEGINLTMSKEMFPAIKKAESIKIYTTRYSIANMYSIWIVSKHPQWMFVSNHVILNMEA